MILQSTEWKSVFVTQKGNKWSKKESTWNEGGFVVPQRQSAAKARLGRRATGGRKIKINCSQGSNFTSTCSYSSVCTADLAGHTRTWVWTTACGWRESEAQRCLKPLLKAGAWTSPMLPQQWCSPGFWIHLSAKEEMDTKLSPSLLFHVSPASLTCPGLHSHASPPISHQWAPHHLVRTWPAQMDHTCALGTHIGRRCITAATASIINLSNSDVLAISSVPSSSPSSLSSYHGCFSCVSISTGHLQALTPAVSSGDRAQRKQHAPQRLPRPSALNKSNVFYFRLQDLIQPLIIYIFLNCLSALNKNTYWAAHSSFHWIIPVNLEARATSE